MVKRKGEKRTKVGNDRKGKNIEEKGKGKPKDRLEPRNETRLPQERRRRRPNVQLTRKPKTLDALKTNDELLLIAKDLVPSPLVQKGGRFNPKRATNVWIRAVCGEEGVGKGGGGGGVVVWDEGCGCCRRKQSRLCVARVVVSCGCGWVCLRGERMNRDVDLNDG